MKHLKTYNESLRDKMVPKDEEEIRQNILNKEGLDKLRYINRYDLGKYFTSKEIQEIYDNLNLIEIIDLAAEEDEYDEIKKAVKNFYDKKDDLVYAFDMSPLHQKITRAYDITGVAFDWNQDAFFDTVEKMFGHGIFSGKKEDMMIVDVLEELSDEELVKLYGILIDKINELPND